MTSTTSRSTGAVASVAAAAFGPATSSDPRHAGILSSNGVAVKQDRGGAADGEAGFGRGASKEGIGVEVAA